MLVAKRQAIRNEYYAVVVLGPQRAGHWQKMLVSDGAVQGLDLASEMLSRFDRDRRCATWCIFIKLMAHNAFISYSHSADGTLAAALQSALHSFAKPSLTTCLTMFSGVQRSRPKCQTREVREENCAGIACDSSSSRPQSRMK